MIECSSFITILGLQCWIRTQHGLYSQNILFPKNTKTIKGVIQMVELQQQEELHLDLDTHIVYF